MDFLYRFRSIDALLGERAELQNRQIYFASPAQLNDPMEGFKDLFWKGDKIVWRNLCKHYVLCLLQTTLVVFISGSEYSPELADNLIFHTESSLPEAPIKGLLAEIYRTCFEDENVNQIIEFLASRSNLIRHEEFTFFIKLLNSRVFPIVLSVLSAHDLMPAIKMPGINPNNRYVKGTIIQLSKLDSEPEAIREDARVAFFIEADQIDQQIRLIYFIRQAEEARSGWWSLCMEFPDQYATRLSKIIYTDWFAACFVSAPNQAAMWGNYADGHKGCCLKFRVEKNDTGVPYLSLSRIIGATAGPRDAQTINGEAVHPFYEVKYVKKFVEIDFFRSIGRIPAGALRRDWYSDEKGNISECADGIFSNEDRWRSHYWKSFESVVTAKLDDWRHEREYRLILISGLFDFLDDDQRTVKYKLDDLVGIIFGVATSLEDKRRIANIVEQLCKDHGRKEFEFSQAYYSARLGRIDIRPLGLVRFE